MELVEWQCMTLHGGTKARPLSHTSRPLLEMDHSVGHTEAMAPGGCAVLGKLANWVGGKEEDSTDGEGGREGS